MFKEEDAHQEKLSELEAALAGLLPRADRLNRDRLMFLAGQASAESKISQPPARAQATWRMSAWAWPAAFATMTGVAATLLLALCIRPAPQVVERFVEQVAKAPAAPREAAAAVVSDKVEDKVEQDLPPSSMVAALPDWLTWGLSPQLDQSAGHEDSYPEIRNQVLLYGLGSWNPQVSAVSAAGGAQEEPISARAQLKLWLEQGRMDGAARRPSTPTKRNPSGVKS